MREGEGHGGVDKFSLTALVRKGSPSTDIARRLGADSVTILDAEKEEGGEEENKYNRAFDVVFDTTGTVHGFQRALSLAKREVHLKSTNGQGVLGMNRLTELVVDEVSLLPFSEEALDFGWGPNNSSLNNITSNPLDKDTDLKDETETTSIMHDIRQTKPGPRNPNIYVSPGVPPSIIEAIRSTNHTIHLGHTPHHHLITDTWLNQQGGSEQLLSTGSPFPRFDLAVVSSAQEIDDVLRPNEGNDRGLVRARGAILIAPYPTSNAEQHQNQQLDLPTLLVHRNLRLSSSRCGDLRRTVSLLSKEPRVASLIEELVTHEYPLSRLEHAMDVASGKVREGGKRAIKVVVDCEK
ncbi:hypothetical protein HK102_005910 [Quaeritorhiza haematococci]|nr:hypothetical protein HK102_005910 [Quaeritorhiza haematococci]